MKKYILHLRLFDGYHFSQIYRSDIFDTKEEAQKKVQSLGKLVINWHEYDESLVCSTKIPEIYYYWYRYSKSEFESLVKPLEENKKSLNLSCEQL